MPKAFAEGGEGGGEAATQAHTREHVKIRCQEPASLKGFKGFKGVKWG